MHAEITHLAKLFKGVQELREVVQQYCLAPDMSVTSIDDLTFAFEQMYDVKIRVGFVPDLKLLRGQYIRVDGDVTIALDENLNPLWRRYIAVKEMCHLILNDSEYVTQDPVALLEALIFEERSPQDGEAPLDLVSDSWAKLAAHEFLFPFKEREWAREQIEKGEHNLFTLASLYEIPQHVVEWAFREDYHQMCKDAWDRIAA